MLCLSNSVFLNLDSSDLSTWDHSTTLEPHKDSAAVQKRQRTRNTKIHILTENAVKINLNFKM